MKHKYLLIIFLIHMTHPNQAMKCGQKEATSHREVKSLQELAFARILQVPCGNKKTEVVKATQLEEKKVPIILQEEIRERAYINLVDCLRSHACTPLLNTDTCNKIDHFLSFIDLHADYSSSILEELVHYWPCTQKLQTFQGFITQLQSNPSAGSLTPARFEHALECALYRYVTKPESECIADIAGILLQTRIALSRQPLDDNLFDHIISQSYYDQVTGTRISTFIQTLLQCNGLTQQAKNLLLQKSFKKASRGIDVYEPLIRSLVRSGAQTTGWSQARIEQLQQITSRS